MKRVDLIKEIAAEFELIANRLSETEVATVASVVELEPQHLAEIVKRAQKLTGPKNVKLKTVIDKSLLAGIIIRYGNSGSKLSLITLRLLNVQKHTISDFYKFFSRFDFARRILLLRVAAVDLSVILPRVLIVSRRSVRKNKFVDFVGVLLCEGDDIDPSHYEADASNLSPKELEEIWRLHTSN
ncbi:hypothetical protein SASPL_156876 [Salvia splendens]|uniref:Uncharacterized protein n=1 Tax=Salvia splendens TaxID=180675 RepID=A0A8X8VVW8_SALSN|nr:hypothetical protein SASPL_156876 [Salvia splendens]